MLVLFGGDEEHSFATAPTRFIDGWNNDQSAIVLGRHQSTYHHYAEVQVLTLSPDGTVEAPEGDAAAICAIAFAASSLDAELAAATIVKRPQGWVALSEQLSDPNRLAELQSTAQSEYNATLTPEGTTEPL